MTPEQRTRLEALLPAMRTNARRAPTQNGYSKRWHQIELISGILNRGKYSEGSVEELIAIAEKAAEGHDKPGIVRMPSMAAVLSGMPPEHKED